MLAALDRVFPPPPVGFDMAAGAAAAGAAAASPDPRSAFARIPPIERGDTQGQGPKLSASTGLKYRGAEHFSLAGFVGFIFIFGFSDQ